jgi:hypothetical protein
MSTLPLKIGPVVVATSVLDQNLSALAVRSPRPAERVRRAGPCPGLAWVTTQDAGAPGAELNGRALASKRRPLEEASRLADSVDLLKAAGVVVLGFGLGYHVEELARRGKDRTVVIVYEPDVALLRAVLEKRDLSELFKRSVVIVFTGADEAASLGECLRGLEGMLAAGIAVVEHPPSAARLGEGAGAFASALTSFAVTMRTQVITTMMQMEVTLRNQLMNVDEYVGGSGVAELEGMARGLPAIVVSAGPSLARNLHLLEDPRVRERVVIVAVQTVLKPLLARGIRPHFVTALDYHEISRRFYEGLREEDVQGITLVVEPKANAAILKAWPGALRVTKSELLDMALGEQAPRHGELAPGATVAHLAYSLARYLGCDPVMLIGQDLAFTDGQYYAAGAAIHDVWANELGPLNTLETMEWQRIVRWRGHLHELKDHLGRKIYTDDQMASYLGQFERVFMVDAEKGLTVIDATEGGARKLHTQAMTLREALQRWCPDEPTGAPVPDFGLPPRRRERGEELRLLLAKVRDGARAISWSCKEAGGLLDQMLEHQQDAARMQRLIDRVNDVRQRVERHEPAYGLVHRLNQAGAFKRFRADRAIALAPSADALEVQKKQIERDRMNVSWLGEAADAVARHFEQTLELLAGGPRLTSDIAPAREQQEAEAQGDADGQGSERAPAVRPVVVIPLSGWVARDLRAPALAGVLARARAVQGAEGVVIAARECDDAATRASLEALVAEAARLAGTDVSIQFAPATAGSASMQAIVRARALSPWSWRTGPASLTCYDELLDPGLIASALERSGADASLVLDPRWPLVDVELCAALLARHRENPDGLPLVFNQAPPGLSGCVVSRKLCEEVAIGRERGDVMASVGGLLAYRPTKPQNDPIVKPCCVQIAGAVRSSPWRFEERMLGPRVWRALCERAAAQPGGNAEWLVGQLDELLRDENLRRTIPCAHVELELTGRRAFEVNGYPRGAPQRGDMPTDRALELVARLGEELPGAALTLGGAGDPLLHDGVIDVVRAAKGLGCVHVRTDLACGPGVIDALLEAGPDVVSVDMHALLGPTFAALTGTDLYERVVSNTQRLLAGRRRAGMLPMPWVVTRIVRRDETYEEI